MTFDQYYLCFAEAALKKSNCCRRRFGAIIVKDEEIVGTGHNNPPRTWRNCFGSGGVGECWRRDNNIPSGERQDRCRSLHAELNAIIHAGRRNCIGATMYLVGISTQTEEYLDSGPCRHCRMVILNSGISRLVTRMADGSIKELCPRSMWGESPNE